MLKHIELSELELGMFVHKMEGNWLDHPFWRSSFMIEDQKRLQHLKESRLRGVIIDTAKGKDVTPSKPSAAEQTQRLAVHSPRLASISRRSKNEASSWKPVSIAQEIHAAEAIANKAKDKLHRTFVSARLGKALNVKSIEPVVNEIFESVRRNPQAFSALMRCKLKNELMFRHALAVSALMVSLGRKMKLPAPDVLQCGLAGLLLDIGVNYLPRTLNPVDDDFRNAEPAIWQQHVLLGYRSLLNDDDLPQPVLDAVLQHHERIDGNGFPNSLEGHKITLFGRMAAICDTFDFLLTRTATAAALDPARAIDHMKGMAGAFDEEILRQFVESVGLYPVGSFVELESGRLAMVIDEDQKDPARPIVQAFYCFRAGEQINPVRVELAKSDADDRIVAIADLAGLDLPEDALLREQIFLSTYRNSP